MAYRSLNIYDLYDTDNVFRVGSAWDGSGTDVVPGRICTVTGLAQHLKMAAIGSIYTVDDTL